MGETDDSSDAALVRRALAGDHDAFTGLIGRHWRTARRAARRVLRDPEDVADVLQEAALAAYLNLRSLSSGERFSGWFCGIVLNHCRMHRRRARRLVSQRLDGTTEGGSLVPVASVEDEVLLSEVARAIPRFQTRNVTPRCSSASTA